MPEWLRYYIAAKLNANVEDLDFNPDDFVARVNSDLVGKYVNIASRCAGFIEKRFGGKLSALRSCRRGRWCATGRAILLATHRTMYEDARVRQGGARGWSRRPHQRATSITRQALGAGQGSRQERGGCRRCAPRRSTLFRYVTVLLAPVLPETQRRAQEFLDLG